MFKRVLIANRGEIAIRIARAASSLGVDSVAVFTPADSLSLHTKLADKAREIGGRRRSGARLSRHRRHHRRGQGKRQRLRPSRLRLPVGERRLRRSAARPRACASSDPRSGDADAVRRQGRGARLCPGAGHSRRPRRAGGARVRRRGQGVGQVHRLSGDAEGVGRRRRPRHARRDEARGDGRGLRALPERGRRRRSAIARCSWRRSCRGRGTSRCRCWATARAMSCISSSATARCSCATRRSSRSPPRPTSTRACASASWPMRSSWPAPRATRTPAPSSSWSNPETGEHFFIECNPRIQVEHTITEQVMGVDLVEAQFRIAAGASLAALGLADQKSVGMPRGFAVQARVVVQGTGTLSAYREPSGPGVRVDACGYLGLAPPPQFDPLLAKLICQSGSSGTFASAVDRLGRALEEFQIVGVPTNGEQLRAILAHPEFRAGNARTTLLSEAPRDAARPSRVRCSSSTSRRQPSVAAAVRRAHRLPGRCRCRPGTRRSKARMPARSSRSRSREGAPVKAGDLLFVVSAMKMETSVAAPCAGVVTTLAALAVGDTVDGGQILAVIKPAAGAAKAAAPVAADESWTPMLDKVAALRGDRPQAPGARLERPGRGPPAQSPQAHLPRAHRRPARSRQLPRDRQPGRLRHLRRGGRRRWNSRRPATSAARAASRAAPASSAPTTSPRAAAMPTARSARSRAISTGCRSSCARPRSACSTARRAAAASPPWCPSRTARRVGQGKHRRHQGRPAARGRRRRLVPARPSRQHLLHRAARHGAGGQHAAGQRGRHRRRQGGARALLGHGARHLPALRRRPAGRQPRHGLRGHQGGSRRLAHPLPQRLGRQPGRVRRGSHGDDAPLPVLPARQRLRGAAGRERRPIPPTAARRSC